MASPEEDQKLHHKVNLTTLKPFSKTFKSGLKETFFPDDPFRHLKKTQSGLGRVGVVLKYYLPVLEWGAKYTLRDLRYDVLSGITVASLAIPQGISYARLADLPPVIGLYSSFVPPLVYAIFGSSKDLAVGNVAAVSLLLASIIRKEVSIDEDPKLYLSLFFTAAFFTGVFQLCLGLFRLGIVVDFFSRSTIIGFMGGTAILIILQQLKGMLGLQHFTTKTGLFSVLHSVFSQTHEWKWESAVLGFIFLSFLLFTRKLKMKKPKLFWVSAISPLVVVILGGILDYFIHAQRHGIPIVGPLKKGLNPLSIRDLKLQPRYLKITAQAGIISGILAIAEGIAVGRSLAILKNYQIDGNKEMIAFGMMNIVGSFTSCYITTGPFSKSAINTNAGCKTPMSNIVASICIMLVLLFLAPLFCYTPLVALSSIIIVAMLGLIEYKEAYHLFKVDKLDFCICMTAFLGVVLVSMDVGLMISVGLSILRALLYVARPSTFKLGNIPNTTLYRDMEQYPYSTSVNGILILQLGSPIYFANSGYLKERISRWVEEEENTSNKGDGDLQYLILDMGGVTSIDAAGIGMLEEVLKDLERRNIKLVLTNPQTKVAEKLVLSKFIDLIGGNWVMLSIEEAIIACRFALHQSKGGESDQVVRTDESSTINIAITVHD